MSVTGEALAKVIKDVNKQFGDDIVKKGSDVELSDMISTGLSSVDYIINGGIPKGRITEIWGNKASGKTSLSLHIAKECQKAGGKVVFIDIEQTFDKNWAEYIGCNPEDIILIQPESAESALEIGYRFIQPEVDLIVFDSIAALSPIREQEKEIGEPTVGETARLMNVAMRKYPVPARKYNVAVLFINQVRDKIGGWSPVGTPETTPGGRAIAFHASLRLSLKSGEPIKNGTDRIGSIITARIEKSKIGKPSGQVQYSFYYACDKPDKECEDCTIAYCPRKRGAFDLVDDLFKTATMTRIISRSGPMYSYGEEKWKGQEEAKKALIENPEMAEKIAQEVREYTRKVI